MDVAFVRAVVPSHKTDLKAGIKQQTNGLLQKIVVGI